MKLSLHRHPPALSSSAWAGTGSPEPQRMEALATCTLEPTFSPTHFPNAEVEWQVSTNRQASPLQSEWAENYISEWQAVRKGQKTLEHRLDGVKPFVRV